MFNRQLDHGAYESFEMRVIVTGQFGVGKTSLVMILVGDEAPHEAQSTDGISLLEDRCGLDIENKDWILIAKGK
jgi:GTPase SAR1 family protein